MTTPFPDRFRLPFTLTPGRVAALSAAVLLMIWLVALFSHGANERRARAEIGQALGQVFGVPVTVDSVQWWGSDLDLYGVRIFNAPGYGADPAIVVSRVTLKQFTAAGARLTAASTRLDGVIVSFALYPDDVNLLALAGKLRASQGIATADGTPLAFSPGAITISSAALHPAQLLDADHYHPIAIDGWTMTPAAGTSPSMLAAQMEAAALQRCFARAAKSGFLGKAGPDVLRQITSEFGVDAAALQEEGRAASTWNTKTKRTAH